MQKSIYTPRLLGIPGSAASNPHLLKKGVRKEKILEGLTKALSGYTLRANEPHPWGDTL